MADYTVKRFDEMEPIFGGFLPESTRVARRQLIRDADPELPPTEESSTPTMTNGESGQEEVYFVLAGSADFDLGGKSVHAEPETARRSP